MNPRSTTPLPTLAALAATLLLLAQDPLLGQAKPKDGSFEINGDYGSVFLPDGSIESPGPVRPLRTQFVWQEAGKYWEHWTDTTYMGKQCYKVRVTPSTSTTVNDRSEQKIMDNWDIGNLSTDPDSHYFTLAFYVESGPPPTSKTSVILSQLWQDPDRNPIMYVSLAQGYVSVQARGDRIHNGGLDKNVWTDLLDPLGGSGKTLPLQVGRWYRFMFRVTPSRSPLSLGRAMVWLMDNATGGWDFKGDVQNVPLGFTTEVPASDPRTREQLLLDYGLGRLPLANKSNLTWKVGTYREPMNVTTRIYLDNVRFTTDKWNLITKNRTIGYHRSIVHLGFDEGSGSIAKDRSHEWNDGWGYQNDGQIAGAQRQASAGVRDACLYFDGVDDHVRVPIPGNEDEFDTGNYLSLAAWIKTRWSQVGRGLITIDEYSTTYKAKLYYVGDSLVEFAVRHPDGTLSYVSGATPRPLTDDDWHLVTGTYNRWAADGKRLKLYLAGTLIGAATGVDKPIWRGEKNLYVGKFSGDHFRGWIDEAMMFNFALSAAQVQSIAGKYVNRVLQPFGVGCAGSNGRVQQTGAGTPMPFGWVEYRLQNGPPGGSCTFSVGVSDSQWGSLRLPFALDSLGGLGCSIYNEPLLMLPLALDRDGQAAVPVRLGSGTTGMRYFTQFLVLDPKGNRLGISTTNGVETVVGGAR